MIRPATLALLLLGLASAPPLLAHEPEVGPTPEVIDAAVRATIARYQLPGIAVGVIDEGKVVYARGYGETVAGSGEPVTNKTLFKIASNSKAMTGAVLARLRQQGKLQWDDPVVKHLPQFAMHDPWVTAHMTVSDLLVQTAAVLASGGKALWPTAQASLRNQLPAAAQAQVVLQDNALTDASVALDAVLHHGDGQALQAVCTALAQRPGPIVGVTAMQPGAVDIPLERLLIEHALSVNTAAAGGNASLMTIG